MGLTDLIKNKISALNELKQIKVKVEHYKQDSIASSINDKSIYNYNRQRNKGKQPIICYAPFKNLYFTRLGEVVVCCHNRDYVIGNYPEQTLKEILAGKRLADLRTNIVGNNLSKGCQVCQYDFDRGSYSQVKANHFDTLPFNKDFPTMMEFEIDITCNLECTMCSGDYSNLIRKNKEHRPPLVMKYDMEFVEQLTPYFKHLHEARFSGGEPFLIDLYYEMWNRIAEYNPHCLISIQSNGTILNNRVKNTLTKGKFEIGISLDSLQKEVFESIRINAKFDTVISNIEYFGAYCKEKKRHLDCQFV
jgi:sulfatase maturation enzyme AslB (radical SAM superfamily)